MHRDPKLILDVDGRIVAVLLGRPEGDDWDDVIAEMARAMDGVQVRGVKQGVFKRQECRHRRGDFYVLKGGLTKGPGQKLITDHPAIRWIAGFQSSGLARYLPKLYRHYKSTMQSIFKHQPELTQLFPNSIFPTATFNLGPDVVTLEHLDMLNYAYGMCAVTSAGKFNHKLSGHIYIEHLKVVLRATTAKPRSLGNETRYSMTQYAAGALFRWAAYGHQTVHLCWLRREGWHARQSEIRMIRDYDINIVSILNSEGMRLIWNKVAHQQTCQGGKWARPGDGWRRHRARMSWVWPIISDVMHGLPPAMDSLPLKKRLFSPKAERALQQREELTRAAGHHHMILQISRLDELIAHSRSEREKGPRHLAARAEGGPGPCELRDLATLRTHRRPQPFKSCIAVGSTPWSIPAALPQCQIPPRQVACFLLVPITSPIFYEIILQPQHLSRVPTHSPTCAKALPSVVIDLASGYDFADTTYITITPPETRR
ncbi:hypothetical protein B0H14DRAFT_2585821 [Mycena olivaceomarginata]|nr:hypothetical protein B0H14DRAFT_2585821 [Mycena olivaceomarginata]